jgi:hypothetical protein
VFHAFAGVLPEADDALEHIGAWIRQRDGAPAPS